LPPQARSMRCSIDPLQHPQSPPAPQAREMSTRECAPLRIAASISRSVTDWQMQRIIGLMKLRMNLNVKGESIAGSGATQAL